MPPRWRRPRLLHELPDIPERALGGGRLAAEEAGDGIGEVPLEASPRRFANPGRAARIANATGSSFDCCASWAIMCVTRSPLSTRPRRIVANARSSGFGSAEFVSALARAS